jgi:hypothetical protein
MLLRLQGLLLFLFIPLVLVLYLRMPLGLTASVLGGIAIMLAHRLVARPWMERHLAERCFWCGRAGAPVDATFSSKGKAIAARACTEDHRDDLHAFAHVVATAKPLLALLILVPVVLYLLNALAAIAGRTIVPLEAASWGFKIPIALAVVTLSFAWPLGRFLTRVPAIDFPVHNLFLLGVNKTFWVFRIVGLFWLGQGVWALFRGWGR